mmetsp:Transcript_38946/g.59206  ORF Transcript_38946/g.59206 Transcript_38946/m.59206 type:complete len:104 (+) Transcript_38946:3181-3492(+)
MEEEQQMKLKLAFQPPAVAPASSGPSSNESPLTHRVQQMSEITADNNLDVIVLPTDNASNFNTPEVPNQQKIIPPPPALGAQDSANQSPAITPASILSNNQNG